MKIIKVSTQSIKALGMDTITVKDDKSFNELKEISKNGFAIPKKITIHFEIANKDTKVQTMEGEEVAKKGGFIITGTVGEKYVISPDKFPKKYTNIKYLNKEKTKGKATKVIDNKKYEYLDPMTNFKATTWAGTIKGDSNDILIRYGDNDYGIIKKKVNGKNFFISLYKV